MVENTYASLVCILELKKNNIKVKVSAMLIDKKERELQHRYNALDTLPANKISKVFNSLFTKMAELKNYKWTQSMVFQEVRQRQ